jgi:hypothetical protein
MFVAQIPDLIPFLSRSFARGIFSSITQGSALSVSLAYFTTRFHRNVESRCCGTINFLIPRKLQDLDPTALALAARVTILKALSEALSHSISTVQLNVYDRDRIVIQSSRGIRAASVAEYY